MSAAIKKRKRYVFVKKCDSCGSSHISETKHYFVCCTCGMTYSKAEAQS